MRPSNKSRSRNKNNNNRRSVGNVVNRVFDSSGPEGKVRGTPQQIIEKYQTLARDAQLSGDRIAAENFLQHCEHYGRMLGEANREQAERREQHEAQRRENQGQDQAPAPSGEQPQVGDEILETAGGGDTGLVETPESAGSKRKPRRDNEDETPPANTEPSAAE